MGIFSSRLERLRKAVDQGKVTKVSKLLAKDPAQTQVDINDLSHHGENLLHLAVRVGYLEATKLLIERGADVNRATNSGYTPFHLAVKVGTLEIARLLLERGVRADARSPEGDSSFMLAVMRGRTDIVKFLLGLGADVNERGANGLTALMVAALHRNVDVTRLLIAKGADIEATAPDGSTALLLVCDQDPPNIMRVLIDRDANVNAQDGQGETALMKVIRKTVGCWRNYRMLVETPRIDVTIANHQGQTARQIAAAKDSVGIANEILAIEEDRKCVSLIDIEKFHRERNVDELVAALKNKNTPEVKVRAIEALGQLGELSATVPLVKVAIEKETPDVTEAVQKAVALFGARAIDRILSMVDEQDPLSYSASRLYPVADLLHSIGGREGRDALISLLPQSQLCWRAAQMLGKIGDPAAVEPLTRVIGGPGYISEQVLEALVKIPDARSILPLLEVYRINRDAGSNSSFNIRGRLLLINALAEIAGDRDRFLQLTEPERHLVLGEVIEIYSRTELFESAYQIHSLLGKLSGFVETTETERLKIQEIDRQFAKYAEIERNRLPYLP